MPLELRPATSADALRAAEIEAAAYAPSPFNKILFPGPMAANALELRAESLVKQLQDDPTTRWLKVVDTDLDDDMIAFAKWHIYTTKPSLTPREFGPECNVEACEALFGGLKRQRTRLLGEMPYVYLHMLQTDPKHQRRGAGSMLIQWGFDEAQKLGLIAYLESSEEGHSVYLKNGFKDIEAHTVKMREWGAERDHNSWAMMWEPSKN